MRRTVHFLSPPLTDTICGRNNRYNTLWVSSEWDKVNCSNCMRVSADKHAEYRWLLAATYTGKHRQQGKVSA